MGKIQSFEELDVWKKGRELVSGVYRITKDFPSEEKYGLVSQMRRSAVSVPSNIAEGFGRRSKLDKMRFYDIAMGSLYECQNQLVLASDQNFVDIMEHETVLGLVKEVQRLLRAWMRGLQNMN